MSEQGDRLGVGMCPGLTSNVISSLKQNGVYTVSDLIAQELEQIASKIRLSCKELDVIRRELSAQFAAEPVPATEKFNELVDTLEEFCTACSELNEYLGGGIYVHEIMEIVGETATGKTQFCISVATGLALSMEMSTLWIDTCGSFDLRTYNRVLEARSIDAEDFKNVSGLHTMTASTPVELLTILENAKRLLSDQDGSFSNVHLIVIDSISVLLSSLSGGPSEGHLVQIARSIKEIASDYPVAVLITNSMTSSSVPPLGRMWASVPNMRLLLQRESADRSQASESDNQDVRRWATLIKSCRQVCRGQVPFTIREYGFVSP